jgi:hypothetical protein
MNSKGASKKNMDSIPRDLKIFSEMFKPAECMMAISVPIF